MKRGLFYLFGFVLLLPLACAEAAALPSEVSGLATGEPTATATPEPQPTVTAAPEPTPSSAESPCETCDTCGGGTVSVGQRVVVTTVVSNGQVCSYYRVDVDCGDVSQTWSADEQSPDCETVLDDVEIRVPERPVLDLEGRIRIRRPTVTLWPPRRGSFECTFDLPLPPSFKPTDLKEFMDELRELGWPCELSFEELKELAEAACECELP